MRRTTSVTVGELCFTVWADAPTLQERLDSLVVTDVSAHFPEWVESARVRSERCYARDDRRWANAYQREAKPKRTK